jgi:multiple antibiotic resistance protein
MHTTISTFFSITLTIFFVIDALGNVPTYLQLVKPYSPKRRVWLATRELLFALGLMLCFHYLGQPLLSLLEVNMATVQIAGGIMLFLIAIRLIFSSENERAKWNVQQEPFFVPLATPMIASPSVLAIIMVLAQKEASQLLVIGAIGLAWFLSSIIFLAANPIYSLIKEKGLDACQRLMGLIVALIAVQLFLEGVLEAFK